MAPRISKSLLNMAHMALQEPAWARLPSLLLSTFLPMSHAASGTRNLLCFCRCIQSVASTGLTSCPSLCFPAPHPVLPPPQTSYQPGRRLRNCIPQWTGSSVKAGPLLFRSLLFILCLTEWMMIQITTSCQRWAQKAGQGLLTFLQ